MTILVGCAGWSLPRAAQPAFGAGESHLARYATRLGVTEINSSFHRPHRRGVYERWAAAVPESFRFCAKLPKAITHERRLADAVEPLSTFLEEAAGLGPKLACLLVQLPPSLAFDAHIAAAFLELLRSQFAQRDALREYRVARVLADPVRHEPGRLPGGWPELVYLRLHGAPRVYYSSYAPELLAALAGRMRMAEDAGAEVWCIFDNTASGAAAADALALQELLGLAAPTA